MPYFENQGAVLYIEDSRFVTIKNAHHGTNLDNPIQVNYEIEKFLAKVYI